MSRNLGFCKKIIISNNKIMKQIFLFTISIFSLSFISLEQPTNNHLSTTQSIDIKVFLEGAYRSVSQSMRTDLSDNYVLPYCQPFNTAPWNYTEQQCANDFTDVVDWVLITFRTVFNDPNSTTLQIAALVKKNGEIIMPDGTENLPTTIAGAQYIIIEHRNHLATITPSPITPNSNVFTYDFTINAAIDQKNIGTKYVIYGGNVKTRAIGAPVEHISSDDTNDSIIGYGLHLGQGNGYYQTDLNMDGIVNIQDFPTYSLLQTNFSRFSFIQL